MRHMQDYYSKSYNGEAIDLTRFQSVMQQEASPKTSNKYSFIPTTRAIEVFKDYGFNPTFCQVSRPNLLDPSYSKHEIRFRDNNLTLPGQCYVEISLRNAHNAKSSFQLNLAVYRKICSNGLMLPDNYESHRIKHIGFTQDKVAYAIESIVSQAPRLADGIRDFQRTTVPGLTSTMAINFAKKAFALRHDPETCSIDHMQLVTPTRYDGDNGNLWGLFNTVQERLVNGLYRYETRTRKGKRQSRRALRVNSIDTSKKLNQNLWSLAETFLAN